MGGQVAGAAWVTEEWGGCGEDGGVQLGLGEVARVRHIPEQLRS